MQQADPSPCRVGREEILSPAEREIPDGAE